MINRKLLTVTEEIREVNDLLSEISKYKKMYPSDESIQIMATSYTARKEILLAEFQEIAVEDQRFIFDMAIQTEEPPLIEDLGKLFAYVNQGIKAIAKSISFKAPELRFCTEFKGSFGIRTISDPEDQLVLGDITETLLTFFSINNDIDSEDFQVLQRFRDNRTALRNFAQYMKKMGTFETSIVFSLLNYQDPSDKRIFEISPEQARHYYKKLIEADVEKPIEIIEKGIVKEINLLSNSFILSIEQEGKKPVNETIDFEAHHVKEIKSCLDIQIEIKYRYEKNYDHELEKTCTKKTLLEILTI